MNLTMAELQHEVVRLSRCQFEVEHHRPRTGSVRVLRTGPAERDGPGTPGPGTPFVSVGPAHGREPETSAQVEHGADTGRSCEALGSPEDHRSAGVRRQRQGLTALDDPSRGHPAAVPDQRPFVVVAAPCIPFERGDGVHSVAADQRRKHGVGIPSRHAQPRQVTARTDERAALTVSQKGIVAQRMWGEVRRNVHGAVLDPRGRAVQGPLRPGSVSRNPRQGSHLRCGILRSVVTFSHAHRQTSTQPAGVPSRNR